MSIAGIVTLRRRWQGRAMKTEALNYHDHRFPPAIVSHTVWLFHRFCLSFRDTEDLPAQRGITRSDRPLQPPSDAARG